MSISSVPSIMGEILKAVYRALYYEGVTLRFAILRLSGLYSSGIMLTTWEMKKSRLKEKALHESVGLL
jgi:hypothetical protein